MLGRTWGARTRTALAACGRSVAGSAVGSAGLGQGAYLEWKAVFREHTKERDQAKGDQEQDTLHS